MDQPSRCRWLLMIWLGLLSLTANLHAAPLFQKNDVIASVGGEDMVVAAEYGELELIATKALPDHQLKFRSLAWEGDTVYEQRRDLNYPKLEEQLETIGATVVICQFGVMESLDGEEKIPAFIEAYDKLLKRLNSNGKRRVVLLTPTVAETSSKWRAVVIAYQKAIQDLATKRSHAIVDVSSVGGDDNKLQRDAVHLTRSGHTLLAKTFAVKTDLAAGLSEDLAKDGASRLQRAIIEKNRLWFHYYRPQNWAFLAGDRTNQPSSRDHLDPSKRWFPAELAEFLPLIDKKETEIHTLAKEITK